MPLYQINMDALDFTVLIGFAFFVGFVACIWARYWVYRLDVRLTVLYLRIWAVAYDQRRRLERRGLVFPVWARSVAAYRGSRVPQTADPRMVLRPTA
jgi:hypothetical protein